MGIFDTLLEAASDYMDSEDGDEMMDTFRGFFSGGDDGDGEGGGSDGEGGGWGSTLGSLFGSDDGEDGDGSGGGSGGWGDVLGGLVDRFSGEGGREGLWDRAVGMAADRVSQYLPEELREVAGQLIGQDGRGSWAGSLLNGADTRVPGGWNGVANHPDIGHSYGEGGFGGFLDHSIANLSGRPGVPDDGIRYIRAPDIEPGRPLGNDAGPDPRVSMPADALRGARFVDSDGDGYIDQIYPQGSLPRRMDGDDDGTEPDGYIPDARGGSRGDTDYDTDGDGYPDRAPDSVDPIGGADIEHGGSLGGAAVSGPAADDRVDYDDLVTRGAGPAAPAYEAPDDPTFPNDPGPATSGPAVEAVEAPAEPPAGDFEQSIGDAEQVDQSMDGMFDGLEGPA
jgi:hypothetical protein